MNEQIKMTASIVALVTGMYGAGAVADGGLHDYAGTLVVMSGVEGSVSDRVSSAEFASMEVVRKVPACRAIEGSFDYTGAQQVRCSSDGAPKEPEWSYLY